MTNKTVNVSDDSGATWYTLPGGTGQFQTEAEQVSDTIYGQQYQSNESGLISWGVTSNAIWKGAAGYNAKILQPGTSTSATAEAMSQIGATNSIQIDDTTKRIWDRSIAVVPSAGASNILDIDYLFGIITFDSGYTVVGSETVDVNYFPTIQLAKGNSYTLTMTAETKDNTDFATVQGNNGYRTFEPGLRTVSLEMTGTYNSADAMRTVVEDRNELIFEVDAIGDGLSVARGFFKVVAATQNGDVGALEEETIMATLTVPDVDTANEPELATPFNFRHEVGTTLDTSVRTIISAYLDETVIDVQYLPLGSEGQTPLDGVEGNVIVTDISLSGGLSDMNVFNATFQGSSQYTVV